MWTSAGGGNAKPVLILGYAMIATTYTSSRRSPSRLRSVLFLFYLLDLIVPMDPSLKPTDKYYYGYHPEHSN